MPTIEDVAALGVASQQAQEVFRALCMENTQIDPEKYRAQVERYEIARAKMHQAMNRHHAALALLGGY